MAEAQPNVASRHHTQRQQIQASCRMLGQIVEVFVEELDPSEDRERLRKLAGELRRCGGPQASGRAPVLHLVPRQ